MLFCSKCGWSVYNNSDEKLVTCDYCKSALIEISEEEWIKLLNESSDVESYVQNHNLDRNLLNARKIKQDEEYYKRTHHKMTVAEANRCLAKTTQTCPTCKSNSVSNIGTIGRATSLLLFGLASGKIGKTKKCNDCGYMW